MNSILTANPKEHGATLQLRRRSLLASSVGNLLEWFDWTIYAVFSPFIAKALFDPSDPTSALLSTLAVFAVGFAFRPLGGILFGTLADRVGRRTTMITTMLLMAAGSLLIAVTPSYAAIGGFASLLLVVARLLQGLAHGGETTASYAYVSEIAPPRHRGLWSSAVFVSVSVGTLFATALGAGISAALPEADAAGWGWRIPFFLGAGLAVVALFLRRGMMESEVYEEQIAATGERTPATETPKLSRRTLIVRGLKLMLYEGGTNVVYYTWTSFAAVFAITYHDMNPSSAFLASVFAQLIYIAAIPIGGFLADTWGRKPVTLIFYSAFIIGIFPLMGMITDEPWTLFIAQSIALVFIALVAGSKPAVLSELLPTQYRTRMLGFSLSLAVAIFGGTAPYLNQWLYGEGLGWAFNVYIIVLCLIGMAVVSTWRETKGVSLQDIT
ncbi:MFS transporter [Rhodococcus zopfii]|uniref:MFS transporter n=1 Tax=Rhodococcus zopfii TaxID=43772 RepID=UPI000A867097|nr:MFS transporter [Rhodococcus zopfii]